MKSIFIKYFILMCIALGNLCFLNAQSISNLGYNIGSFDYSTLYKRGHIALPTKQHQQHSNPQPSVRSSNKSEALTGANKVSEVYTQKQLLNTAIWKSYNQLVIEKFMKSDTIENWTILHQINKLMLNLIKDSDKQEDLENKLQIVSTTNEMLDLFVSFL